MEKKIGETHPQSITIRSTKFTEEFMINEAFRLGMKSKAEFGRVIMDCIALNGNGIVDEILKDSKWNEWFTNKKLRGLEPTPTPKKEKRSARNSGTRTVVKLPNGNETVTNNFQAYLKEAWPQEDGKDRKYYDAIRSDFRHPLSQKQIEKHKTHPYILYKLKRDEDGLFRRYSQNQTTHARVCDEMGNIIPVSDQIKKEKKKKPKKKSIGVTTTPITKEVKAVPQSPDGVKCPECGKPMVVKGSRLYGDFYGCTAYPQCNGSRSIKEEEDTTPVKPEVKSPIKKMPSGYSNPARW